MGLWSDQINLSLNRGIISNAGADTPMGQMIRLFGFGFSNLNAWTAQRAVYSPIIIQKQTIITHLISYVSTQNGNWNMGIYEEDGTAVVIGTKSAVPAPGIASLDIADTTLSPGFYFIALWSDSSTVVFPSNGFGAQVVRVCGVRQQTGLATDLPATATFATYTTAVCPIMAATLKTTF